MIWYLITGALIFGAGVYFGHALAMAMYNIAIHKELEEMKHGGKQK